MVRDFLITFNVKYLRDFHTRSAITTMVATPLKRWEKVKLHFVYKSFAIGPVSNTNRNQRACNHEYLSSASPIKYKMQTGASIEHRGGNRDGCAKRPSVISVIIAHIADYFGLRDMLAGKKKKIKARDGGMRAHGNSADGCFAQRCGRRKNNARPTHQDARAHTTVGTWYIFGAGGINLLAFPRTGTRCC